MGVDGADDRRAASWTGVGMISFKVAVFTREGRGGGDVLAAITLDC